MNEEMMKEMMKETIADCINIYSDLLFKGLGLLAQGERYIDRNDVISIILYCRDDFNDRLKGTDLKEDRNDS